MMIATLRAKPLARLAVAAAMALAVTSVNTRAEAIASSTATPAATTTMLNASARVGAPKATPAAGKPAVRARHAVRIAAKPQTCTWFACGRQQVSFLLLGIGF